MPDLHPTPDTESRTMVSTELHLYSGFRLQSHQVRFELVDDNLPPILGLYLCVQLGIVRRVDDITTENIVDEFPECFVDSGLPWQRT